MIFPKAFWTDEPLALNELSLLNATLAAHAESAARGNVSHQVLQATAVASGHYANAIAGALLTLGAVHGPLVQTWHLLAVANPQRKAADMVAAGLRVPGWGNSFHKGKPDPLWAGVAGMLERDFGAMHTTIENITASLHAAGKMLYPNPSCYTAAVAILLGMPAELCPYLFLRGRLDEWSKAFHLALSH